MPEPEGKSGSSYRVLPVRSTLVTEEVLSLLGKRNTTLELSALFRRLFLRVQ